MTVSRRNVLLTAGAFTTWALMPKIASAAGSRDPRFLFVVMRGAVDGLSVILPEFDPAFQSVRAGLVVGTDDGSPSLELSDGFRLNPRMPNLHALYQAGEALSVHAVATPYRERSHFDGQNVLESGGRIPGELREGWLNRALQAVPAERSADARAGLAAGAALPLVMMGKAPVTNWMPAGYPNGSPDTRARLIDLYRHTAPQLAAALSEGTELEARLNDGAGGKEEYKGLIKAMDHVGRMLAAPDGFRIASLDVNGFDTHVTEKPASGRLGNLLATLDQGIAQLKVALGPAWASTVVVFATEFGRTARMNGTAGTDHGTGGIALMVGGAVNGGRVIADWPGLGDKDLYEQRDLKPTMDLRAALKGVLADHLGMPERLLSERIFPGSGSVTPLPGLIA